MTNINYPDFDPEYEAVDPADLGWIEIAPHIWRKPDGVVFKFPLGDQRDVILRLKLPDDPKRQH